MNIKNALDTRQPRVLICDPIASDGVDLLREQFEVDIKTGLSEAELLAVIPDYEAVVVRSATRITAEIIEHGINLRVIARAGSGLDNVDVAAAREREITVLNSPNANTLAVAEHTMGLLLSLARRVPLADHALKEGRWEKKGLLGTGLSGKTLGIIGFGRIGNEVAIRARAFGMRLLVNQRRPTPQLDLAEDIEAVDLLELLRRSDFISLHVPLTDETRDMIGAQQFELMKPTAFLINTARGGIIDEEALLAALENEQIAGAALDVFVQEPADPSALIKHQRLIATPHIGASTEDAQQMASLTVATSIIELLQQVEVEPILPLRVVALDRVICHEDVDPRRVEKLASRIAADGSLRNPPIVTEVGDIYLVLDGASRTTAFRHLEFEHIIVQVTSPEEGLELAAWYHVILQITAPDLIRLLDELPVVTLKPAEPGRADEVMFEYGGLCQVKTVDGDDYVVYAAPGANRLDALNQLTNAYIKAAVVHRTLRDDLISLQHEYPDMAALVLFPEYSVSQVIQATVSGERKFPAGITRFLVPGRVMRLNADLAQLKSKGSLTEKNRWLHDLLVEKQIEGRIRYYGEPVYLLDD
jgi:phosphoglycerate dehydrogenase-like enzyme